MAKDELNFTVSLSFEEVSLPPFRDILILGKKCPQGKIGVAKCFNLLSPEGFEMLEIDDELVEAILVSKRILKRMPPKTIIDILKTRVFPRITRGEIVKVDFSVKLYVENIGGTLEELNED